MSKNFQINLKGFKDQMDIVINDYILKNSIDSEKVKQKCSVCGKYFKAVWKIDKCPKCKRLSEDF